MHRKETFIPYPWRDFRSVFLLLMHSWKLCDIAFLLVARHVSNPAPVSFLLIAGPTTELESKERAEAERETTYGNVNGLLWEAANETTASANIKKYLRTKVLETAAVAEKSKRQPSARAKITLPPRLLFYSRRHRTLDLNCSLGILPPMSNSILIELTGQLGNNAINDVINGLSKDRLSKEGSTWTSRALEDLLAMARLLPTHFWTQQN